MRRLSATLSTLLAVSMMVGCAASSSQDNQTEAMSVDVNQTGAVDIASEVRLQEVYWRLIGVEGKAVLQNANEREAYIILKLEKQRLQGFGGCNILMGSYDISEAEHKVHFSRVASTMMACPRLSDESAFLKVLERVEHYRIQDGVLLLQKEGKTMATFEAVYQP
ncbi:META domain-containing protein [Sulfurospirillum oryzae]|uniref:META domain-containing protein n=1 Tax=Sulfurospirillum oryzae TaxID=2976535 RepID=UPI0021E7FA50|nr:META domain-containing protein [Sulfurospirillum oryzae]